MAADADHGLAAYHAYRGLVLVAVDADKHGRPLAGLELPDDLVRDHDSGGAGAGAGGGNGRLIGRAGQRGQ
jgi:hypothetical protein